MSVQCCLAARASRIFSVTSQNGLTVLIFTCNRFAIAGEGSSSNTSRSLFENSRVREVPQLTFSAMSHKHSITSSNGILVRGTCEQPFFHHNSCHRHEAALNQKKGFNAPCPARQHITFDMPRASLLHDRSMPMQLLVHMQKA